jgi:hypothetical protein
LPRPSITVPFVIANVIVNAPCVVWMDAELLRFVGTGFSAMAFK